jgi:DNA-binding LacI/PurR family transcriptional regulator
VAACAPTIGWRIVQENRVIKKTSIADVAKLAGVSRTTVSYVLNNVPTIHISEKTRQRVLNAAHGLHYHPNASAQRQYHADLY